MKKLAILFAVSFVFACGGGGGGSSSSTAVNQNLTAEQIQRNATTPSAFIMLGF
jgi:hypothetical protein